MIVIIDYGLGNLGSIANMLKKLGIKATISSDPAVIETASKLILPGVGAFDNGIRNLSARGLIPLLNAKVLEEKTPVLGLCLGMQLMTQRSDEGVLPGLGWLEAETIRLSFDENQHNLRVPHMGWNRVYPVRPNPLFDQVDGILRFYFAHSYHVVCKDRSDVLATTTYGHELTAAVMKDNIIGVQFHPEKSHKFGLQLFKNFVERV